MSSDAPKKQKRGIFVSGTDTGVGKTFVSSVLTAAFRARRIPCGYWKPIQTGMDSDTLTVAQWADLSADELIQPAYHFSLPQAPSRAAAAENAEIQLDVIQSRWNELEPQTWIVEGAGGLLVPLNSKLTLRDLIVALKLPLVLVARTQLGTINHTLLSVEAARSVGIQLAGLILVGKEDPGLSQILTQFSGAPVLGEIPHYSELTSACVLECALKYFPENSLEKGF